MLRVAVVVDDLVCDEMHQSHCGAITVGSDYRSDVVLFGAKVPRQHKLFDYRAGHYFLDVPMHVKGKISLGDKAMTISAMRQRFGRSSTRGDVLRVKLSPRARGKLVIGESTVLFQFAAPKPVPPHLPFPTQFRPRFEEFLNRRDQIVFASTTAVMAPFFSYYAVTEYDDSFDPDDIDERFVTALGLAPKEEEPEPEEETKQDELALEDEEKEKEEEKEKPKPEIKLDKQPEKFSAAAMKEARGVGVARVLGTYGGPGEGTVFDVIESTENNLGELFAQGMTTTVLADGGDISPFVPGGQGIDAHGAAVDNIGLVTGEGPALAERDDKRERVVQGRTKASKTDVFGDVDKNQMRQYINRRTSALQSCYNKALRTQPDLAGKMSYTIQISVMGNVTSVSVEEDTLGSSDVKACTVAKIRGWRFPAAEDTAEINFSVVFSGS